MRHDKGRDQRTGWTSGSAIVPFRRMSDRPRHRDRRRLRPAVLSLEDRKLLSTFTVNSTGDTYTGSDDAGTLNWCLGQASTYGGNDTIVFSSSVFGTHQTINLTQGELQLTNYTGTTTIEGPAAGVTINAGGKSRVLMISSPASISGLTITGGTAANHGGGIAVYNSLTLTDCTISGNTTGGSGAGIYSNHDLVLDNSTVEHNTAGNNGGGIDSTSDLVINGSTISSNSSGFNGGGIENQGPSLTLTNTSVEDNSARLSGGGLANDGTTVTITGGTIQGNTAGLTGGGVHNTDEMTISGASISDNIAVTAGGGLSNRGNGNLTMTNCTVSGNEALGGSVPGYNIYSRLGSGGGISSAKVLTMTDCTISGNMAEGDGGGIYLYHDTATVVDCTIAANAALYSGGGLEDQGTVSVTADTFTRNSANIGGAIDNYGGLYTVNIEDTILAGDSAVVSGPEFDETAHSLGHNLVAETNGGSGWISSDLTGTKASPLNALLGQLGSYGGPTMTVPLLPGSPALGAGVAVSGVAKDQRGDPLDTPAPDIGAFQSHGFTLTVVAGDSPQVAPTHGAFTSPLAVTVKANDSAEPVAGGVVRFAAPSSGASATLSSGTATVGSNDVASVTATANGDAGSYSVTASAAGVKTPAQFQLTNADTDSNWSGYAAATSISDPQDNSVTYVAGSWTVPTVTPTSGNTLSGAWVGIDGFTNGTVEQTGIAEGIDDGHAYYSAWWEMFPSPPVYLTSMTVSPGDKITASVTYESSGTYAGDFLLSIDDTSHSADSYSIYASPSLYQGTVPERSSAEWIMEAPGTPLADFGTIGFTNCSATIDGVTGAINNSHWQSEAMDIVDSSGNVQDLTGPLNSAGNGFSVTFVSSYGPETAGASAGAVLGTESGLGATTTLLSPSKEKRIVVVPQASVWTAASSHLRFSTLIARPKAPGSTLFAIDKGA
jgi:hypothetical protein